MGRPGSFFSGPLRKSTPQFGDRDREHPLAESHGDLAVVQDDAMAATLPE
jgi:hypothetical protein